jgi:hypothetical protein
MTSKWLDSIRAIDLYVDQLAGLSSLITLTTFNTIHERFNCEIQREATPSTWEPLTHSPIHRPGGGTPLYDAINVMGRALAAENPDRCAILIVTDGQATTSATSQEQASQILEWCRAKGWQVTFIGCDFNNLRMAKLLGNDSSNTIGVATARLPEVIRSLADKRKLYGASGSDIGFSDSEKQQFGGYLEHRASRDENV